MYGSLDAAQRWGEQYAQVLETGGFSRGVASPCHFSTKTWRRTFWYTAMIFFRVGREEGREHALSLLRGAYELSKVVTLGPESSQSQAASFLGRTLTLRQWRIQYEPGQQHVSRALKALGLTNAKGVATSGTNDVGGPKPVKSVSCAERQNGMIPRKRSKRRMIFSVEKTETVSECGGEVPGQVLVLDATVFSKCLTSAPAGFAPGPSGCTNEMPKVCLDDAEVMQHLFFAAQDMARAQIPDTARTFMFATMTAFRKKDGGVRGIATGTSSRKFVAKTVASSGRWLSPSEHHFNLPGQAILSIDGIGAYDHALRSAMMCKLLSVPGL